MIGITLLGTAVGVDGLLLLSLGWTGEHEIDELLGWLAGSSVLLRRGCLMVDSVVEVLWR